MAWAVVVAVVAAGVGCGDDDRRTAADGDTPAPGPVAVADDGGPTETGADVPAVPPDGTSDGGVDLAALPPELRVLAEAVRSGAAASRVQAIEALEQLGGDAAAVLPELEAAMADGPAEVRIAAARALSVIRKAERDTSVELTPTDVAGTYTAGPIAVFTSVKWLVPTTRRRRCTRRCTRCWLSPSRCRRTRRWRGCGRCSPGRPGG